MHPLLNLPVDLTQEITSYLHPLDFANLRFLNRDFRSHFSGSYWSLLKPGWPEDSPLGGWLRLYYQRKTSQDVSQGEGVEAEAGSGMAGSIRDDPIGDYLTTLERFRRAVYLKEDKVWQFFDLGCDDDEEEEHPAEREIVQLAVDVENEILVSAHTDGAFKFADLRRDSCNMWPVNTGNNASDPPATGTPAGHSHTGQQLLGMVDASEPFDTQGDGGGRRTLENIMLRCGMLLIVTKCSLIPQRFLADVDIEFSIYKFSRTPQQHAQDALSVVVPPNHLTCEFVTRFRITHVHTYIPHKTYTLNRHIFALLCPFESGLYTGCIHSQLPPDPRRAPVYHIDLAKSPPLYHFNPIELSGQPIQHLQLHGGADRIPELESYELAGLGEKILVKQNDPGSPDEYVLLRIIDTAVAPGRYTTSYYRWEIEDEYVTNNEFYYGPLACRKSTAPRPDNRDSGIDSEEHVSWVEYAVDCHGENTNLLPKHWYSFDHIRHEDLQQLDSQEDPYFSPSDDPPFSPSDEPSQESLLSATHLVDETRHGCNPYFNDHWGEMSSPPPSLRILFNSLAHPITARSYFGSKQDDFEHEYGSDPSHRAPLPPDHPYSRTKPARLNIPFQKQNDVYGIVTICYTQSTGQVPKYPQLDAVRLSMPYHNLLYIPPSHPAIQQDLVSEDRSRIWVSKHRQWIVWGTRKAGWVGRFD